MLLTKKKLYKIRNSKIQSRKRYKKKKKGRKKRKNKSFRKRRKALNLRKRTLKYKKKGGARNELFVVLPKEKTGNLIRSFVLARITKPDNISSAEFIAILSGEPRTTPNAKAFMQSMKHMTSLFGEDGGGGGTNTQHFHGIQLYNRNLTFAEFCDLRNRLLRAQISGDLTRQAAIEIIQPLVGVKAEEIAGDEEKEDIPIPRPVLPTRPEEPEEEYEEDFEDPCAGVKCDPGEKCVDGDCVEDDYNDPEDAFEREPRPHTRDLPSITGQTDGTEDADIICGGDADCPDTKPICFNGRCFLHLAE